MSGAATLSAWAEGALPGARFLQIGSLGDTTNASAVEAARLGARDIALLDPAEPRDPAWAAAREAVARVSPLRLECLAGRDPLDRAAERDGRLRRWGVVWCARQVFHTPDPLALIRRCAELSEGIVVLRSTRVPEIAGTLREGEAVCAMDAGDHRLPAIRAALEARGVRLAQFAPGEPVRDLPWGGRYAPGMWTWFFTVGALEDLLWSCGLEPVERFDEWGDLAVNLVARKLRRAAPLWHADVRLPDAPDAMADARHCVPADAGAEAVASPGGGDVAARCAAAVDATPAGGDAPGAPARGADGDPARAGAEAGPPAEPGPVGHAG